MPTSLKQLLKPFVPKPLRGPIRKAMHWASPSNVVRELQQRTHGMTIISLESSLKDSEIEWDSWLTQIHEQTWLYADLAESDLQQLKQKFPDKVASTLSSADRVMAHEFDLLGSGPTVCNDKERSATPGGYQPIDWYHDATTRLDFPRGIPKEEWELYSMRPGNADIKWPWEISRCQHFGVLGQAYRLSGDNKYAQEIANQIDDFMEANSVGIGVNWTCTMDVAIRAMNWALGLTLIKTSTALNSEFWTRAYGALFDHGIFIFNNFENNYEVTSNHFLSNISGLFYLGEIFKTLPEGRVWRKYCRKQLGKEIHVQILEDGADYESSVPYHRLVLELFLGPARLAQLAGEPFSEKYHHQLHRMTDFLFGVLRPDGLMPQIGDADDGRLHILTDYGSWKPQDARHILGPAGHLLNEPQWLACAGPDGHWEAAWWGFGVGGRPEPAQAPPDRFELFAPSGLAVARNRGHYLLVTNGIVGTNGFGNHKHNDHLAFEYHHNGVPFLVDPGSHVYTSDFDSRNLFRSTAYHNTLCVDGTEQNDFKTEWLFRMFETAHTQTELWKDHGEWIEFVGSHRGFERLDSPVTHRRRFGWHKESGALRIEDRITGTGKHNLHWHFHAAPGVKIEGKGTDYHLSNGDQRIVIQIPKGLEGTIVDAGYSPSYGVRLPCQALDLKMSVNLEHNSSWSFVIAGAEWLARPEAKRVLASISEV